MANIFISYSSKDRRFVRDLAQDLRRLNHKVWLDEWQIRVGEQIVAKIQQGIERADFLVVVLSKHSVISGWVEEEWQAKYWDGVNKRQIRVLPVLLESCRIPSLLRGKKFADFRGRTKYFTGLVELERSVSSMQDRSGLKTVYKDFVEMDCWQELFGASTSLDLVVMYSATWRNTYLNFIKQLLKKRGGRLRVILPEVPPKSPLLQVYAKRLNLTPKELRQRISLAVKEFGSLSKHGRVEVYASKRYFQHAMYLFNRSSILALYSFKQERTATPAFLIEQGELMDFLHAEFEWLISNDSQTRCIVPQNRKVHGTRQRH